MFSFIVLGHLIMLIGGVLSFLGVFSMVRSRGRDRVARSSMFYGFIAIILGAVLAVELGGMHPELLINPFAK